VGFFYSKNRQYCLYDKKVTTFIINDVVMIMANLGETYKKQEGDVLHP